MWLSSLCSLDEAASQRLLRMEQELRQHLRGQDVALDTVSKKIRKSAAGLKDPKWPFASFVFLGPNPASWHKLARALAWFLFDDEKATLLFEMSEYNDSGGLARFIGSPDGEEGIFAAAVRKTPCSVIVFNEIERGHRALLELFFRVRDDGQILDGQGKLLEFRTCVVIATTNVGSKWITPHCEPKNADEWRRCWSLLRTEFEREFPNEFLYRAEFVLFSAEPCAEPGRGGTP